MSFCHIYIYIYIYIYTERERERERERDFRPFLCGGLFINFLKEDVV